MAKKQGGRPPLLKRRQKTFLLAQNTIELLEKARWDLRISYGALLDRAVSLAYGDLEDDAPATVAPEAKSAPRKAAPDEYGEYCQMRGLYDLGQIRKSARGKELADLYETRYTRERRGV